jgi:membrane-bound acyltransferase YfiQ involved in biofilm formation
MFEIRMLNSGLIASGFGLLTKFGDSGNELLVILLLLLLLLLLCLLTAWNLLKIM